MEGWGVVGLLTTLTTAIGASLRWWDMPEWEEWVAMLTWVWIVGGVSWSLKMFWQNWMTRHKVSSVEVMGAPGARVEIETGDILRIAERRGGTTIVGMNEDFECELRTNGGKIAESSLQGQVTTQWYGDSENLKSKLETERDGGGKAEIGTTVATSHNGRRTIWVVMSRWNEITGRYSTTVPELEQGMQGLWAGIRREHNVDEDIYCPVVGAKFGKITDESCQLILKRHIRSYVQALKEGKLARTMTFVVSVEEGKHMRKNGVIEDLTEFLRTECRRETLPEGTREPEGRKPVGTGIG